MDWALHDHTARRATPTSRLDPVCTYWRMLGPSGRTLTCGLYQTDAGLELRCGYGIDDPMRTHLCTSEAAAAFFAAGWKRAVVALGRFTDLDAPPQ